jgi:hypothetical protein
MIGNAIAGLYGTGVAPSTTAYESIATTTVGSGGTATITFSSIPATYTHLQIRGIIRGTRSNSSAFAQNIAIQYNNDSTSNYNGHELRGDGSSASSFANGQSAVSNVIDIGPGSTSTANSFGAFICDILDYTSTNKTKVMRSLAGADLNGSGGIVLNSGLWLTSNAAITSITLLTQPGGNNFAQYSQFALYGIKG